jgi:GT2 family glycosyltransferase
VTAPAVSIVVPTYQRGRLAAATLQALAGVDPPAGGFEVVVVDDGSDDEHAAELEAEIATRPAFRLIRQPNRGPASARNAGIASTSAPLVAFLDDDCFPASDWLARLVRSLDEGGDDVAAVGGRVLPAPATNWVSRFCAAVEYSSGVQPVFENAATANACYRRSVLEELGGFDEGFRYPGGDDPDLSRRARQAGYRLLFVPDAIVYHAEFESYRDFVAHMYRRGIGEARLARKARREVRAIARMLLLPVFLARTAIICWRRTAGKGGLPIRLFWVALETVGRTAFVAGSLRGLVAGQ